MIIRRKILFIIFILLSVFNLRSSIVFATQQGFYFGYKLSFYNLFDPGFHAFRRNHQFILGYQNIPIGSSAINLDAQYNWIDEVRGSVSTHTLNAWVIGIEGNSPYPALDINSARIKYTYFANLLFPEQNYGVFGVEYQKIYNSPNFFGRLRAGIGYSHKLLPIYGINIIYLPNLYTNVNFKFNWLEESEDNSQSIWKFPLSLGFAGRFSSQSGYSISNINEGLGLEYVWDPTRSSLIPTFKDKVPNYWLKGYIGDKLWM